MSVIQQNIPIINYVLRNYYDYLDHIKNLVNNNQVLIPNNYTYYDPDKTFEIKNMILYDFNNNNLIEKKVDIPNYYFYNGLPIIMVNYNINFNEEKINNEYYWYEKIKEVKKYIDNNNKKPSNYDKDKEIKSLSKWISHQITKYNKKEEIMKNNKIYSIWSDFINSDKYKKYFITKKKVI